MEIEINSINVKVSKRCSLMHFVHSKNSKDKIKVNEYVIEKMNE